MGVIPNFYTSYIYDAAPLTWKQKISLLLAYTGHIDPGCVIRRQASLLVEEQANNSYAGYGRGGRATANVTLQSLSTDAAVTS